MARFRLNNIISSSAHAIAGAIRSLRPVWRNSLALLGLLLLAGVLAIILGNVFRLPTEQSGATTTFLEENPDELADVPDAAFDRGSSLVVGADSPFRIINPLYSTGDGENDAAALIFEPLIRLDATGEPEGVLALSWIYDADSHRLAFRLRNDHTFRDGRVVSPADVIFTYQCLLADSYDGPMQGRFAAISAVGAGDLPDEVVFTLDGAALSPDLKLFTIGILKSDHYQLSLDRVFEMGSSKAEPEGSGAYTLVSFSETEAVLALRSGYGNRVRSVTIREIDSADKYGLLMNGELDIARNSWDIRMQERADTLTAFNLTRFSTSVDCYFLVNPELRMFNTIQLPSQRLAVLLAAAGRQMSDLQQSALEGLSGRQLTLYYFAGLDDNVAEANRLKAEKIANRLVSAGLSLQREPLDWPELAERASNGEYDILLMPVTSNNRLPEKTVLLGDEVQPGASAIIAEYRHEVFIVSKRLAQLTVNPAGHPFAALSGSWTDRLENVLILNRDGSILEEETP